MPKHVFESFWRKFANMFANVLVYITTAWCCLSWIPARFT